MLRFKQTYISNVSVSPCGWKLWSTIAEFLQDTIFIKIFLQLVDLGEPVYYHASVSGCRPQDAACSIRSGLCGPHGQCVGGLRRPRCECDPGWMGSTCASPTVPVRLGMASYAKMALSFSPEPWTVQVQVRVRMQGPRSGMLVQLAARHHAAALTLHVSFPISSAITFSFCSFRALLLLLLLSLTS